MKLSKIILIFICIFISSGIVLMCTLKDIPDVKLDTVAVNEIVKISEENWNKLSEDKFQQSNLDFIIMDKYEKNLYSSKKGLSQNMNDAIKNRDTIVNIKKNGDIVGKIIFKNNINIVLDEIRMRFICNVIICMAMFFIISTGYLIYVNRKLIRPFHKLKDFSESIARGNLDIPLEFNKTNLFGSFIQSLDIMRDELAKAKEKEVLLDKSKKELVAQLSHDIKTPVASIKAVSEVMMLKSKDEREIQQLNIINSKADQIHLLISNMFHATLEELQELSVSPIENESLLIEELINNADYDNRVEIDNIPECIVIFDKLRLQQVLDNVISNSYKYAGTDIIVLFELNYDSLDILIRDFGESMSKEDLALVFEKFHRGKNSHGKSGSGLGLYISRYLMEQMSGDITCKILEDGFCVTISLQLYGNN